MRLPFNANRKPENRIYTADEICNAIDNKVDQMRNNYYADKEEQRLKVFPWILFMGVILAILAAGMYVFNLLINLS